MMGVPQALTRAVEEARAFAYIPDPEGLNPLDAMLKDHWETAQEVEAAGGADCDGQSIWACLRACALAEGRGTWRILVGRVKVQGAWLGHMWVEVIDEGGRRWWADPTWHLMPADPSAMGFPALRQPVEGYRFDGVIFDGPIGYEVLA